MFVNARSTSVEEEDEGVETDDSTSEAVQSLTFLWWNVREKWFLYTPHSVMKLDSCDELHKVLRLYFPASQPWNRNENVYLSLVRQAAQKRLLQLHYPCSCCEDEFESLSSDEMLKYLE